LVPTASVISFGVSTVFWSICAWWRRNRLLYCNSSLNENDRDLPSCLQALQHVYRRGLDWFQQSWSFCLGYSSVLIHCVSWMRTAGRNAGYIAVPHQRDGSRPSLLFAGTSACIKKRSQLVPTAVLVLSFGLAMSFCPFALRIAHCGAWQDETPDILQFHINEMDRDIPSCLWVLWRVYRRCLDWFLQCQSFRFGLFVCFDPFCTWTRTTGQNGRLGWDSTSTRWIATFPLVCGYFGMYTEEVWSGSNSVSHFVWVAHLFWSTLSHTRAAG
jgi:hypothetical protein